MSDAVIIAAMAAASPVVTILGVCAIFRQPIGEKIRELLHLRIKKTKNGYEAEVHAAEQRQVEATKEPEKIAPPAPPPPPAPAQSGAPSSPQWPAPNEVYAPFERDMARRLQEAFGDDHDLKLAWALRLFSQAAVERGHELNYRMFVSSQIFALKRLNEMVRVPLVRSREVYDAAALANPQAYHGFSFETWLNYLLGTGYIHVDGGEVPMASLTPLGRDFLYWMVGRQVPELKPY